MIKVNTATTGVMTHAGVIPRPVDLAMIKVNTATTGVMTPVQCNTKAASRPGNDQGKHKY